MVDDQEVERQLLAADRGFERAKEWCGGERAEGTCGEVAKTVCAGRAAIAHVAPQLAPRFPMPVGKRGAALGVEADPLGRWQEAARGAFLEEVPQRIGAAACRNGMLAEIPGPIEQARGSDQMVGPHQPLLPSRQAAARAVPPPASDSASLPTAPNPDGSAVSARPILSEHGQAIDQCLGERQYGYCPSNRGLAPRNLPSGARRISIRASTVHMAPSPCGWTDEACAHSPPPSRRSVARADPVGGFSAHSGAPVIPADFDHGCALAALALRLGAVDVRRIRRQRHQRGGAIARPWVATTESGELTMIFRPSAMERREVPLHQGLAFRVLERAALGMEDEQVRHQ